METALSILDPKTGVCAVVRGRWRLDLWDISVLAHGDARGTQTGIGGHSQALLSTAAPATAHRLGLFGWGADDFGRPCVRTFQNRPRC